MPFCSNCGAEVFGKFCSKCGNNCGNEQDLVKSQGEKQNENIKETIADLYTLRAGISCAVQKKEDYEKSKKSINDCIGNADAQIEEKKGAIFDQKGIILSRKTISAEKPSEKLRRLDDIISKYKEEAKKYNKITIVLFIIAGIFAVFGIFNMLGGAAFIIGDLVNDFGPFPILIPCAIVFFICVGIAGCFSEKKDKSLKSAESVRNGEDYKKVLREIGIISNADADIRNAEKTIKDLENQLVNLNVTREKECKRLKCEPVPHLIYANGIYDALVKEFSALIDTRDWANLDLVIFYFETGRAKSMQEALQLVDRQRQNDRIVEAINEASYQICNTINAGIEHIQNVVVGCAKILSTQLDEIASQQKALGREISNLQISASSMQSALKSKANVSSNQLAEDIRQMRIYAENEAIRKRNS